jgi:uncharacterized SAM-binding protein YcdF (DUF218 family)
MTWLNYLLQPLVLLWLTGLVLLASLWRRRQERRRRWALFTGVFLLLTIVCLPATNYLALGSLEWRYPPLGQRPEGIDAIVVLAGASRPPEAQGLAALPAEDTLYRCLRAVEMYRQGPPCPVVVSGGQMTPNLPVPALARVMRDFLIGQGIPAEKVVEEDKSLSTYENAVRTARLLHQRGLQRVLLVTSGHHLERAVRCFRRQGIDVVPCGCQYRARDFGTSPARFLPDPTAAWGVAQALHEWLGLAWYGLCGRI